MAPKDFPPRIAYFISPHGYGHAARAAAIMTALHELEPALHFDIFTTVPVRFFSDSIQGAFSYHPVLTDVGLAQATPLRQDLEETIRKLGELYPVKEGLARGIADGMKARGTSLAVCDISPVGIEAAHAAGIPSLLVENFTWDWIYAGYVAEAPGLEPFIAYLAGVYGRADKRIQFAPPCEPVESDLTVPPVSRVFRNPRMATRMALKARNGRPLVLITMGGIEQRYDFLASLGAFHDVDFVIPGNSDETRRVGNLSLLPHHSEFYHPDLINAVDVVIGKVGYSTLAEVYHAGVPFGYVARRGFPESDVLVRFVEEEMAGVPISPEDFESGRWTEALPALLDMPRVKRMVPNGSRLVADYILGMLPG